MAVFQNIDRAPHRENPMRSANADLARQRNCRSSRAAFSELPARTHGMIEQ